MALIEEDVENRGLPSFDAITKRKDPRYKWFVRGYGNKCWELDALSPVVLREKIKGCILRNIDIAYWERCAITERAERESLVEVMGTWKSLLSIGARP